MGEDMIAYLKRTLTDWRADGAMDEQLTPVYDRIDEIKRWMAGVKEQSKRVRKSSSPAPAVKTATAEQIERERAILKEWRERNR